MSSRRIGSVAADSNVLLSAIAEQAAKRVFEKAPGLIVVSTHFNKAEIEEYAPGFAVRYGLDEDLVFDALELLPVQFYSEEAFIERLPEARRLVASRDPDDIPLAALALKLEIPIWSNDRDYRGFLFGLSTTAQLLKALGA